MVFYKGKFIILTPNHELYSIDTGDNKMEDFCTDTSLKLDKIEVVGDTLFGLTRFYVREGHYPFDSVFEYQMLRFENGLWKPFEKLLADSTTPPNEFFVWETRTQEIFATIYEDADYTVYDEPIYHAFNGRNIYFHNKKNGRISMCRMLYNNFSINRIDSIFILSGTIQSSRSLIEFSEIRLPEKQLNEKIPWEKQTTFAVSIRKRKKFWAAHWNEYFSFVQNGKLLFLASPENTSQFSHYPFRNVDNDHHPGAKLHPDDTETIHNHPQDFVGVYAYDTGAIRLIDTILSTRLYSFKDSGQIIDNRFPAAYPDVEHRKQYSDIYVFYEVNSVFDETGNSNRQFLNLGRNFVAIKGNKMKIYHFER